jgi:hypothetical protein
MEGNSSLNWPNLKIDAKSVQYAVQLDTLPLFATSVMVIHIGDLLNVHINNGNLVAEEVPRNQDAVKTKDMTAIG